MTSFSQLMAAVDASLAARADGTPAEPAPAPEPEVDALEWSRAIAGRYWSVATEQQRSLAVATLNRDYLVGETLKPPGPTLAELRAMLDAQQPEPAVEVGPDAAPGPRRVIEIAGRNYSVRPAAVDPGIGAAAFSVFRLDTAARHRVRVDRLGVPHCDCGDAAWRRGGGDGYCKHVIALAAHGMLPGLAVAAPGTAPATAGAGGVTTDDEDEDIDPVVPPGEGPCADWPAWADADVWQLGPDPDDREPAPIGLALDEWVRGQAALYRAIDHDAADLIAEALEGLLCEIEVTHARTPAQLRDRRAALLGAYEPRRGAPTPGRPGWTTAGRAARWRATRTAATGPSRNCPDPTRGRATWPGPAIP